MVRRYDVSIALILVFGSLTLELSSSLTGRAPKSLRIEISCRKSHDLSLVRRLWIFSHIEEEIN